jgi:hypothetical protein
MPERNTGICFLGSLEREVLSGPGCVLAQRARFGFGTEGIAPMGSAATEVRENPT